MKRVLIITYYWPPSGGAGVQRWLKFAKYLPKYGWEPIILTVDPKCASYPVLDASLNKDIHPDLKVIRTRSRESFSTYKKVSGSEKIPFAGFAGEENRTSLKEKVARFVRGNFFLPDPRKGWNRFALKEARKIIERENISCLITSSPPHSTQLIGRKLSSEYNLPWIADLRDPWTDIYYYKLFYPTLFAHRINLRMEKDVLKNASSILTVSNALKDLLVSKVPASATKIRVIHNGFDPADFHDLPEPDLKRFIITYVGTMAESYPLDTFLVAYSKFVEENEDALLRFIGTVSPAVQKAVQEIAPQNIEVLPYMEHRMAIKCMRESSLLLLLIPDTVNNKGIITGKLFEYMAVGRPVLNLGPLDGDAAGILKDCSAGKTLLHSDETSIMELLNSWKKNPPKQGSPEKFSRKELTAILSDELNSFDS